MTKIERVAVLGAGTMGHGIAQVCAATGCEVSLYDIDEAANQASTSRPVPAEEQEELQAPKFEPPKAAPASTEEKA